MSSSSKTPQASQDPNQESESRSGKQPKITSSSNKAKGCYPPFGNEPHWMRSINELSQSNASESILPQHVQQSILAADLNNLKMSLEESIKNEQAMKKEVRTMKATVSSVIANHKLLVNTVINSFSMIKTVNDKVDEAARRQGQLEDQHCDYRGQKEKLEKDLAEQQEKFQQLNEEVAKIKKVVSGRWAAGGQLLGDQPQGGIIINNNYGEINNFGGQMRVQSRRAPFQDSPPANTNRRQDMNIQRWEDIKKKKADKNGTTAWGKPDSTGEQWKI